MKTSPLLENFRIKNPPVVPVIVIFMADGNVSEIASSHPTRVNVVDYDVDGIADEELENIQVPGVQDEKRPALLTIDEAGFEFSRVDHVLVQLNQAVPEDAGDFEAGTPRVAVVIKGGQFQGTLTDRPVHVLVVDYDADGIESNELSRGLDPDDEDDLQSIARFDHPVINRSQVDALWAKIDPEFVTDDAPTLSVSPQKSRRTAPR